MKSLFSVFGISKLFNFGGVLAYHHTSQLVHQFETAHFPLQQEIEISGLQPSLPTAVESAQFAALPVRGMLGSLVNMST